MKLSIFTEQKQPEPEIRLKLRECAGSVILEMVDITGHAIPQGEIAVFWVTSGKLLMSKASFPNPEFVHTATGAGKILDD
jgi:hypothetical protein